MCKQERERRCCVLRGQNEKDEERFTAYHVAAAPFVHPFRHPSFHATQLRAITFAKMTKQRLFWLTACDKIVAQDASRGSEKDEMRNERWLEFHDRFTSGILGLLPLVRDLPIRFTESVGKKAREM